MKPNPDKAATMALLQTWTEQHEGLQVLWSAIDAAVKQALAWAAQTLAEIIAADEWPKRLPRYDEAQPKGAIA